MSNIKLKDHNWAAEGIYDTNQSKSQQTINSDVSTKIGQATLQTSSQNLSGATNELKGRADTLDSKYDNVVTVANTQPSSQYNKVWLPLTVSEGTQVPTWAEHQALESSLNGSITSVENSIAIVSNNNTHAAIAIGQYVYIKNHGTLAEGLYQNSTNAAIPQNEALSASNVTAVSGGGLNAFVGKKLVPVIDTLFSSTNPTLMEDGHTYPWNSGILPVNNYIGFMWIFYPSSTAVSAQKIMLDEIGTANQSHYSLATSPTGQVRIRHTVTDAYYDFTSSDSTIYLHRLFGFRYEIN